MTTQIIPIKCPHLNYSNMRTEGAPVSDMLLKIVDDVPVAIICNKAQLRGADGRELEEITDEERRQAERTIPEGGKFTCSLFYTQGSECIYTKPFIRFREDIDDNLINP
jgi:methylaspartate ammonia-lyase